MPRLQLRPYTEDHIPLLYEAARESVAEVGPWLPWCHERYSRAEATDWIREKMRRFAAGTEYQFAMLATDGRFLGGCGLNHMIPLHHLANVGYWVRTSAAGQGIATAAVKQLAEWAFAHTDLVRLEILAAVGNLPSQQVARKAGAVREGVLAKRLHAHGVWHDAILYSIVSPEAPSAGGESKETSSQGSFS